MEQSQAQTVAQAVQAATQQQQQQQQVAQASPPVQASQPVQSSTIDNLTCQWQGCGERCDSAEALYDHVCERHVGRKSTNNLNLTCQWGACRTTTVKRDHITSHIRVHVPLKPHKCDFCGKAFKRPQDLKKHVKTHADDSVLMNSPNPNQNSRSGLQNGGGMGQQNGKPGYYPAGQDGHMNNPYSNYQPALGQNAGNAPYPPAQNGQYAGYGSVNYPNSSALADIQSMDTRRRAIEALNDFLGDIKRRAINPTEYYDVGQRLQGNSLPLPIPNGTGYNTGYNNGGGNYSNMSTASLLESFNHANMGGSGGMGGGPMVQQGYSLPLPNARTKNDLQDIDRFLEQLQHTVYETSTQASAAGYQQAGVHSQLPHDYSFGNNSMRSSNSPTDFSQLGSGSGMSGGAMSSGGGNNNIPAFDATPALTPAASVSSYSSAHSPMSSHSRSSLGSMSGSAIYPSLPSVTNISDLGSGYPSTTSAPASGLASGFEGLGEPRRYSGGRLQRQAPAEQDTEMADAEDGSRTPRASDNKRPKSKGNSSIDPALRGEEERSPSSASTPAAQSEGTEDKKQEDWVENMRIIEALRKWVGERIKNQEYDQESTPQDAKMMETAQMAEKMANVAADNAKSDERDVKYPTLPQSA